MHVYENREKTRFDDDDERVRSSNRRAELWSTWRLRYRRQQRRRRRRQ